jgi:hypothetical protein
MPKRTFPPNHEDKKAKKLLEEIAKKQPGKTAPSKKHLAAS